MDYRTVPLQKTNKKGEFQGNRLQAAHVIGKLLEALFAQDAGKSSRHPEDTQNRRAETRAQIRLRKRDLILRERCRDWTVCVHHVGER